MQSWMGSDFTNDDLVRESSIVKDYTHQLLGTETIEGQVLQDQLIPRRMPRWCGGKGHLLDRHRKVHADESGILR